MNVYVESNTEQNRWWVHMDGWRVGFSTCAEAEAFRARLVTRLNAPHSLDRLAGRSAGTGQVSVGKPAASLPTEVDLPCAKEA